MKDLTRKLVEAWGPSGFEHQIRDLIKDEVKDLCDEMHIDALGNLICKIGEKTDSNKRVMVAAHMDEIGMMISHIDRQGYLRFTSIGGLFPPTLMGNRVKFENGVIGTIGVDDFWSNYNKTSQLSDFYIDVSVGSSDDGVNDVGDIQVGDVAAFTRSFEARGKRWISKSMDDRIGCLVAIEAMRKLKQGGNVAHEVFFVFTTQEEVGTRGAQTSAYGLDPDLGIALDVTPAGDEIKTKIADVKLGQGTAIKFMDRGMIVPSEVSTMMMQIAEKHNIPHQREILLIGSTDARAIQLNKAGIASGAISIPCRYVHTVSETVDEEDVQASIDLLAAILSTADLGF